MKQEYVLGFVFSGDLSKVALIQKNRPDWQKGYLNGIGGKIESVGEGYLEQPLDAMIREFKEEAGVLTTDMDWTGWGVLDSERFIIYLYKNFSDQILNQISTQTDEIISIYKVSDILNDKFPTLDNIKWLLTSAIDENVRYINIEY